MDLSCTFRSVVAVSVICFLLSFRPQIMAQETNSSSGNINCLVVHAGALIGCNEKIVGQTFATENVSVAQTAISSLPTVPPSLDKPNGGTGVAVFAFHGTLSNRVQTKDAEVTEIYTGDFTKVVVDEKFRPLGEIAILKPEIWWPAGGNGTVEFYTTDLPNRHLRALWSRPSLVNGTWVLKERYFSVAVQVFQRQHAIRTAIFTGTKSIESKGLIFKHTVSSTLKDAPLSLKDTPWIDDDDYQLKCSAIKIQQ